MTPGRPAPKRHQRDIQPMEPSKPQRPDTRRPQLVAPPGACDCHCHIVGPATLYPFASERSFDPPDASEDAYLRMLQAIGFERTVIVQPSVYGTDNRRTLAAVAAFGRQRARGVAMITETVADDELERLDAGGIRAVRFITTAGGGPGIDSLAAVAARVAPLGWHVEMYVPPASWPSLLPVIETLPVPVVFDHMASLSTDESRNDPAVVEAILALLRAERAWVKLCACRASAAGHPFADAVPLAQMLHDTAPARCVWGSDWPNFNMSHMPDIGNLVDLLLDWLPDPAARKAVLADNPARLYRFDA